MAALIAKAAVELAYVGAALGCFYWLVHATSHLAFGAAS